MEVKGTGLTTTRDFVKTKFPDQFEKWRDSLPGNSKELFSRPIDATNWYPMKEGYDIPLNKIIEMFYNGNIKKGAEEVGVFSAEKALTGFYKVFLIIATPQYLISRASKIFSTFYNPSEIFVQEKGSKTATVHIRKFDELTEAIEIRIAAWIKKATEMTNTRDPQYQIVKSLTKGHDFSEIIFTWS